jgi:hypothetical protein
MPLVVVGWLTIFQLFQIRGATVLVVVACILVYTTVHLNNQVNISFLMIHFTRAELEALRSRLELEIGGLQTELDCVENALEQLEDDFSV